MKTAYIDMDDTLLDYAGRHAEMLKARPQQVFPQSQIGFFLSLKPIKNAVWAYNTLKDNGYRVLFLTAPSVYNPASYAEKRMSIEKHFGFDACYDLIIAHDKSLLRGDVLIDNSLTSNKQSEFIGRVIQFGSEQYPNWDAVVFELTGIRPYTYEVPVTESHGDYSKQSITEAKAAPEIDWFGTCFPSGTKYSTVAFYGGGDDGGIKRIVEAALLQHTTFKTITVCRAYPMHNRQNADIWFAFHASLNGSTVTGRMTYAFLYNYEFYTSYLSRVATWIDDDSWVARIDEN